MENSNKKSNDFIKDFGALFKTAHTAGINLVSADQCAKVLTALYLFGGENEDFVFNTVLLFHIKEAQRRFNIKGGERPTAEGITLIQQYTKGVENWLKASDYGKTDLRAPEWLYELEQRYKIRIYELDNTTNRKIKK
jgi:hypothetical protein